jgi:uncharacterized membrane protein YkvA (DUF1232 family)
VTGWRPAHDGGRTRATHGPTRGMLVDCPSPSTGDGPTAERINTAMAPTTRARTKQQNLTSASLGRFVSLLAFLPIASRIPDYARLVTALVLDERTPASNKLLLGAAAGYLVVGRDLIPDDIPIIGGLDDLVVVILAVDLFLDGVPTDLLDEKIRDLDIDRVAFYRDIAQIRRLTPGPVRRTIRRVPGLVSTAGDAISKLGLGPRVRTWINREDPIP